VRCGRDSGRAVNLILGCCGCMKCGEKCGATRPYKEPSPGYACEQEPVKTDGKGEDVTLLQQACVVGDSARVGRAA
jgi:hypothetical protein